MISDLSYIHPNAKIGKNVQIDPFSVIHDNVEIGDGTWVASNVTILGGARIGKNCKIFPGAVISAIPQDLKFKGEETIVKIGDNCTIRECVTINRGTIARDETVIGNNCLIMAYSHVAHDCSIGDNCVFSNDTTLAGHITIENNVVLAGLVAVQQFVHIGQFAYVAGGSLVRKDIPPYSKAGREPLSYIGVNSVGLKRGGFDPDTIRSIQDIYRILFVKGYNISNGLKFIEAEIPYSEHRDKILNFIHNSERGVMRGFNRSNQNDDFA